MMLRLASPEEAGGEEKGTDQKAGRDGGRVDGVQRAWDADVQMERRGFVPGVCKGQRGREGEQSEKEFFEFHKPKRVRRTRVGSKRDGG